RFFGDSAIKKAATGRMPTFSVPTFAHIPLKSKAFFIRKLACFLKVWHATAVDRTRCNYVRSHLRDGQKPLSAQARWRRHRRNRGAKRWITSNRPRLQRPWSKPVAASSRCRPATSSSAARSQAPFSASPPASPTCRRCPRPRRFLLNRRRGKTPGSHRTHARAKLRGDTRRIQSRTKALSRRLHVGVADRACGSHPARITWRPCRRNCAYACG